MFLKQYGHAHVWCECPYCVGVLPAAAAQPAEWPQRHGACRLPRKACQMKWSCARVGVEVSKAAGMTPEHSPVPPEASRRSEGRRPASDGADVAQRAPEIFLFWPLLYLAEIRAVHEYA